MSKIIIQTSAAPQAIGNYSQAIAVGEIVYLSGQIGLHPQTMQLVEGIDAEVRRVFANLQAVAIAAGGELNNIVKLNIYLTDLGHFALVNTIMAEFFTAPYPARAVVGVASLPRGAQIEADATLFLD